MPRTWPNKPILGAKVNFAHPLSKGLVGLWLMNEGRGDKVYDLSGNKNTGTLINMAAPSTVVSGWNPGKDGPALDFDGGNDYVDLGQLDEIEGVSQFTIAVWIKTTSRTDYDGIINSYDSNVDRIGISVGGTAVGDNNDIVFQVGDGVNNVAYYTTSNFLSDDIWYYITMVFNGGLAGAERIRGYVNGVKQSLTQLDGNDAPATSPSIADSLKIGFERLSRYFNGTISETRIYNRALSAKEIQQLYEDPYSIFERKEIASYAGGLSFSSSSSSYSSSSYSSSSHSTVIACIDTDLAQASFSFSSSSSSFSSSSSSFSSSSSSSFSSSSSSFSSSSSSFSSSCSSSFSSSSSSSSFSSSSSSLSSFSSSSSSFSSSCSSSFSSSSSSFSSSSSSSFSSSSSSFSSSSFSSSSFSSSSSSFSSSSFSSSSSSSFSSSSSSFSSSCSSSFSSCSSSFSSSSSSSFSSCSSSFSSSCSSSFSSSSCSSSFSSSSSSRCPRQFGGNWQRKLWYNETTEYYWRARYDIGNDKFVFEYSNDLTSDNWVANGNADIDCSGFAVGAIDADFTIRGKCAVLKTTIHYSDGIDTWIAESDEASATGWAWANLTKVFDGTDPNHYRKVNLCADRQTPTYKLYATAVFYNNTGGIQHVVCKIQSTGGDITGWGASKDISDNTNTDTILGESCRSIGPGGAAKDDVLFVYKEGIAIKSQYMSAGVTKGIQSVDDTAYSGRAMFDFEHGVELDEKHGHVIYVDADGTIKWRERLSGNTTAWDATETMTNETTGHAGVAIVEHGTGLLYAIWREGALLKYRLHRCKPAETWSPTLVNPANSFDPSTDAVVDTTSVAQLQTADSIPITDNIMGAWIGQIGVNLCEIGWGILIGSRTTIYSRYKELNLPTDDSDMDIPFIDTEYVDVSIDDDVYVQQCARDVLDPYGIFVWKDAYTDNKSVIILQCILKASRAPSTNTVYLQIYNRNSALWETIDSDNATAADIEFTLSGTQSTNLSYYYDENFFTVCRIYQKVE